jgi:hypothetical protein
MVSLIMNLNDRKKIWIIVGSFVFASGVLYFLFMTAWLNTFLFLGYLRPVTIGIGLFALGAGIVSLRKYVKTGGAMVCSVGDQESHKKTMKRVEEVIAAPLSWGIFFSILVLAFMINAVEFACSSGIPAVFTQVLALQDLPAWQYYGYILLYDAFFMLDDLIIFSLAAFAVSSGVGEKYAKYCKLIGGVVMVLLGLMLLFFPGLLR